MSEIKYTPELDSNKGLNVLPLNPSDLTDLKTRLGDTFARVEGDSHEGSTGQVFHVHTDKEDFAVKTTKVDPRQNVQTGTYQNELKSLRSEAKLAQKLTGVKGFAIDIASNPDSAAFLIAPYIEGKHPDDFFENKRGNDSTSLRLGVVRDALGSFQGAQERGIYLVDAGQENILLSEKEGKVQTYRIDVEGAIDIANIVTVLKEQAVQKRGSTLERHIQETKNLENAITLLENNPKNLFDALKLVPSDLVHGQLVDPRLKPVSNLDRVPKTLGKFVEETLAKGLDQSKLSQLPKELVELLEKAKKDGEKIDPSKFVADVLSQLSDEKMNEYLTIAKTEMPAQPMTESDLVLSRAQKLQNIPFENDNFVLRKGRLDTASAYMKGLTTFNKAESLNMIGILIGKQAIPEEATNTEDAVTKLALAITSRGFRLDDGMVFSLASKVIANKGENDERLKDIWARFLFSSDGAPEHDYFKVGLKSAA